MKRHKLRIGALVEVRRADGEKRRGYILRGPLECLAHIGPFYHVGALPPGKRGPGRPRKGQKEPEAAEFGLYDARDITVIK